jgi:hypothetical protein
VGRWLLGRCDQADDVVFGISEAAVFDPRQWTLNQVTGGRTAPEPGADVPYQDGWALCSLLLSDRAMWAARR